MAVLEDQDAQGLGLARRFGGFFGTLRAARRRRHGRYPDTFRSPSFGTIFVILNERRPVTVLAPTNGSASRGLQDVGGSSGYTARARMLGMLSGKAFPTGGGPTP